MYSHPFPFFRLGLPFEVRDLSFEVPRNEPNKMFGMLSIIGPLVLFLYQVLRFGLFAVSLSFLCCRLLAHDIELNFEQNVGCYFAIIKLAASYCEILNFLFLFPLIYFLSFVASSGNMALMCFHLGYLLHMV